MRDPIVAIATPYGRSAIGVIRLSGKNVLNIAKKFFKGKSTIKPRYAHYGIFTDQKGNTLDEVVLVYYKAPNSYTGEDMIEISFHGNPLILKKALEVFISAGCRLAEPGEFTKRAFLNGKMDLTQAEAVAELISAQTELARQTAIKQLQGELSAYIKPLRENLLELCTLLEADIEFSEEDIPSISSSEIINRLEEILKTLRELLKTAKTGKLIREGLKLAIVGKPNVGKSSLFNALLKEERSIVTDLEGTTRDYIEETVNLRGIPVILTDTAGIRKSSDPVERLGVERSKRKIQDAHVILFVVDGSSTLTEEDFTVYEEVRNKNCIVVVNKCDLGICIPLEIFDGHSIIKVSAVKGYGLKNLEEEILKKVGALVEESSSIYISVRHEELLKKSKGILEELKDRLKKEEVSPEIAMLYVREAFDYLGEIIGAVAVEDILEKIFSKFCIGK